VPSPSPEAVVENIRRTLHAGIGHYAALLPEAICGEAEDEMFDLAQLLGIDWTEAARPGVSALLRTLAQAALEDQQAASQQRAPVTTAVDRWLERWFSGKEAGRMP
jgi:hypothetical protein